MHGDPSRAGVQAKCNQLLLALIVVLSGSTGSMSAVATLAYDVVAKHKG